MRKMLFFMVGLLAFSCAGKAGGSEGVAEGDGFDFCKYREQIQKNAYPRYSKSAEEVNLIEYALIDIDGDGKQELWVRGDEGQDWQGVFAIEGNSVELLADADVCSELEFYKNAVGFSSYISPGKVDEGYSVLKDSRIVSSAVMSMKFNIFSEEQEVEDEWYYVDGKGVDEAAYQKFKEQLGDTVEVKAEWHEIK